MRGTVHIWWQCLLFFSISICVVHALNSSLCIMKCGYDDHIMGSICPVFQFSIMWSMCFHRYSANGEWPPYYLPYMNVWSKPMLGVLDAMLKIFFLLCYNVVCGLCMNVYCRLKRLVASRIFLQSLCDQVVQCTNTHLIHVYELWRFMVYNEMIIPICVNVYYYACKVYDPWSVRKYLN